MFKKIKDKILNFLSDNYIGIIILAIVFLLCNIKLDFSIYAPGGLINIDKRIESKNTTYKSSGSINMTYVKMVKGTPMTYILAHIIPSWDIYKDEDISYDGDIDKTFDIDKYYLKESISNAFINAYNKAGINYKIKSTSNYIVYIYEKSKTNLEIFDDIKEYDGIKFTSISELQEYIGNKNVGEKINFIVERNGKEKKCYAYVINISNESKIGISSVTVNEYDSDNLVSIKTDSNESGSSGGFMMSLAIYNKIVKKDITNGKIISGTGTIDSEGNVGEIGGVTYKLQGAYNNKADIFLVPAANYDEAIKYKKKHKLNIDVIKINTFSEAIDYLTNMGD